MRSMASPLSDEKILVTGPAGQIAFPLAARLAQDNDVWGIARFSDAKTRERCEAARITTRAVDLSDPDWSDVPDDFTYVLHLAASIVDGYDYDRAIAIKPEDGLSHVRRGVILQQKKLWAEAVESYRTGLVYRPGDPQVIRRIGDCLNQMQQYEPAAAAYREALELDPDDADLMVRMGFTLYRLGRFDAAEQAVARALELSPGKPEWARLLEEIGKARAAAGAQG